MPLVHTVNNNKKELVDKRKEQSEHSESNFRVLFLTTIPKIGPSSLFNRKGMQTLSKGPGTVTAAEG